jgi:hypothetical protein
LAQLLDNFSNSSNCSSGKCYISILNSNNYWVIDSEATDHMTETLDQLKNTVRSKNYQSVIITNGSKVSIDQIGTTNILSNDIFGVLYLSNFTSNLLSVSKITQELNYNVIFSPHNLIFQDIVTKMTIDERKLANELYYLDFSNKALVANSIEENKLWHWRVMPLMLF